MLIGGRTSYLTYREQRATLLARNRDLAFLVSQAIIPTSLYSAIRLLHKAPSSPMVEINGGSMFIDQALLFTLN